MSHALFALLLQVVIGLVTGGWWAGAALGVGLFVGREHACAEYRWIEQFGLGKRANMPWWGGFDPKVWPKADQWLDWILPTIAVIVVAVAAD